MMSIIKIESLYFLLLNVQIFTSKCANGNLLFYMKDHHSYSFDFIFHGDLSKTFKNLILNITVPQ